MAATIVLALASCSKEDKEQYYERHIEFPEFLTLEGKVDMASRLVPTAQQLAWQQLELTAFVHFGINTFTDREWGDGNEDPTLFNPTNLDTDQWVKVLNNAGFKMVILTAKHHDGFCLWPTKTTDYSVKASPWRDGKGDVVADLAKSCKKYGMKLGLYLSPWDRNHPTYGQGEAYNQVYLEQLRELLTNYGKVDEVWFDGANGEGPNGKKQEYNWEAVINLIAELQPDAITAIMGQDVRWVGNERGLGRETEWSATVLPPGSYSKAREIEDALNISATAQDLGSREVLANAKEVFWYPSEVDVSIRPGWFYHADQHAKSLEELAHIYFSSVGMNSSLLLNIPPNREGLFDAGDIARIVEFGAFIEAFNKDDAIKNFKPFTLEAGEYQELYVDVEQLISAIVLQEDITKGQRVESFELEGLVGEEWTKLGSGTTIGYKRIILLEQSVRASKLRVKLLESRGKAYFSNIAARLVPDISATVAMDEDKWMDKSDWKVSNKGALTIDMGKELNINGFSYIPAGSNDEIVTHFLLEASTDGKSWKRVDSGEFGNIVNNPIPQFRTFGKEIKAKHIRFSGKNQQDKETKVSIDELNFY